MAVELIRVLPSRWLELGRRLRRSGKVAAGCMQQRRELQGNAAVFDMTSAV